MCRVCPVHTREHGHLPYVDGDREAHGCAPMTEWPAGVAYPIGPSDEGVIQLRSHATLLRMVHKGLRKLGVRQLHWLDEE